MSDKIGYLYNPITFEYQNSIKLNVDPIEYKILMPNNCTLLAPPEYQKGEQIPVYNYTRRKWELIADHSGIWYDVENGNEVIINTIYDISQANINDVQDTLAQRIPYQYEFKVLTLASGKKLVRENPANHYTGLSFNFLEWSFADKCFKPKSDMTALIKAIKNALQDEYKKLINTDIAYKDKIIQVDESSLNILQQKIITMDDECQIEWNTKDNSFINLSKKEIFEIISATQIRNQVYFVAYQNTKSALKECKDYEELQALFPQWTSIVNNEPINTQNNSNDNRFSVFYENIKKLQKVYNNTHSNQHKG